MLHARRRPALANDASAARRLLAVFCGFAFLFVSTTHALSHYDAVNTGFEFQAGDVIDSNDNPKSTTANIDHCCGCAGVALPITDVLTPPGLVETKLTLRPAKRVRAHDPTFVTPPPKS
jgi:hypothetical protein